jgi:two-component system repressor protein LuxO
MQVKLLRFVQTGTFSPVGSSKATKVDVRFVCATNRDPMLEVQAGRFREDLYYRLYVVPVELPPLRDRGDDVMLIARHFLTQFAREEHRRFRGFSPAAEKMLAAYPWPGNVRQLQNVVRNIVVLHDADLVGPEMIPPPVNRPYAHEPPPPMPAPVAAETAAGEAAPEVAVPVAARIAEPVGASAGLSRAIVSEIEIMPLAEMERRLVLAALARTDGDIPRAAALLEINPSTVYRKVSAWRKDGSMPA